MAHRIHFLELSSQENQAHNLNIIVPEIVGKIQPALIGPIQNPVLIFFTASFSLAESLIFLQQEKCEIEY